MTKKHDTFPGEQAEMPQPKQQPEVNQPADPKEPEMPVEDPQSVPEDLPQVDKPEEDSPLRTE